MKVLKLLFILLFFISFTTKADLKKNSNPSNCVFKENKGQVSDQNYKPRTDVLFYGNAGHLDYYLKNNGISYQMQKVTKWKEETNAKFRNSEKRKIADQIEIYRLDIEWLNANETSIIKKDNSLPDYDNYYSSSCPNGVTNVKSYLGITYKKIYSGIDLHYYSKNGGLKYDYIVQPHSDYKQIQLKVDGAESMFVNLNNELVIKTPLGEIIEAVPVVIQGNRILPSKWVVDGNIISFEIKKIDPNESFTIDPMVRDWATFYGGSIQEWGNGCYEDASGNVYLVGDTESNNNIATVGAHKTSFSGTINGFVTKFTSTGSRLWGTYYGAGSTYVNGVCTDKSGNVYFTGRAGGSVTGTVIATLGSQQPTYMGIWDAYLVKLNTSGVRQWGTFYGDVGDDQGFACAIDKFDNIFITGITGSYNSTLIATPGTQDPVGYGGIDAFLAKFTTGGTRLWGTYCGDFSYDYGNAIAFDTSAANVYLCGETSTPNFFTMTTPLAHQTTYGGGTTDGFIEKYNSSTGQRIWGTFYGGGGWDAVYTCASDKNDNLFIAGYTSTPAGTKISTPGSFQPTNGNTSSGGDDGFLVKFDANGVRIWGTFYGDGSSDKIYTCKADTLGNCYIAGFTNSVTNTLVATPGSYQPTSVYGQHGFLANFDPAGVRQWGTYFGGGVNEAIKSMVISKSGAVYAVGISVASPVGMIASPSSFQPYPTSNSSEAFLVKFIDCPTAVYLSTSNSALCLGETSTITASGATSYTWSTGSNSPSFAVTPTATAVIIYTLSATTGSCTLLSAISITINPLPTFTAISTPSAICTGSYVTLSGNGPYSYSWTPVNTSPTVTTTYTVTGVDVTGCYLTHTVQVIVNNKPTVIAVANPSNICVGQSVTLTASGANTYTWSWSTSVTTSTAVDTPTASTFYFLDGKDINGCTNNTGVNVTVSACTFVNEYLQNQYTNNIYPNPNSGEFVISLGNLPEEMKAEIYNTLGDKIAEIKLIQYKTNINLADYPSGLYLIRFISQNKIVSSEKLIKN